MMQPSDLETKFISPLPSHGKKHNRTTTPKLPNHLSVVKSTDEIHHSENSPPNFTDNCKSLTSNHKDNQADTGEICTKVIEKGDRPSQSNIDGKGTQGFLPVLQNPNFLSLWGGQVFCQLADKVYLVLMIALIHTQFHRGEETISAWVSVLMMAFTIPAVLFGSLAGVFVDRWSKKAVLVATNICRGILVLGIPGLLWLTRDWQPIGKFPVGFAIILGVTFLVSTLTQFFAPAEQAAIPLVVPEENLLSANSLYTTTMMASVIVGFAIGEPLLAAADSLWFRIGGSDGFGKELLVGGSYAIAGLILLLLVTHEKPQAQEKESPHVFADLRDGFLYLKENIRLRNALIQLVILFSVFAALTVLAVSIAEVIPDIKPEQFGFLLAAGGVGIALGATSLGNLGQRFSFTQLSLIGCAGMTVALTGLSIFTQQLWMVLILITLVGVFGALVGIPMQTTIQTETPPEMRGKVFGLQNNVINIALSLPLALAGVAETFVGLRTVFLGLAVIVLLGGVFTWYNSPRSSSN
ncbi:MFS transporter [Calothrix sp. 336/3]|uniref:MFS transporter n=1 Tax=Calothrix sp. 336/3 TaxID=1337936 RepID=UPI0004E3B021|nr:MFS transporter [Calothrix sp. 336/3]AKG24101.1 MFS transporter [Calothrix sp. 336/3]